MDQVTSPVGDAPDVVKTVLSLPIAMVAAPIVIISRAASKGRTRG